MTTELNIFKLPVFPPADYFPMMLEEDLAELAADIKANGLRHPVVVADFPVDGDPKKTKTMLVDGRNRRAACKIAGIKQFADNEVLRLPADTDPLTYVHSADMRSDITKSQRVMGYAARFSEAEAGGREQKRARTGTFHGVPHQYLAEVRTVIDNLHEVDLSPTR